MAVMIVAHRETLFRKKYSSEVKYIVEHKSNKL